MRFRKIQTFLAIAFTTLIIFAAAFLAGHISKRQDLLAFWTAARLFPKNPYSFDLTAKMLGLSYAVPIKNPPWALLFVLPLGMFRFDVAFALWAVVTIVLVTGCARTVWSLSNPTPSLAPAVLSLLFGPTVVLLMLGQVTVLVLLGVILFVVMAKQQHYWIAGASLLLVTVKPHVALLFLIAVALWTIQFRRWAVFLSGGLVLITASLISLAINPQIFNQFLERTKVVVSETESYQNVGGMLYAASGNHVLALVPQLIGIVWLAFYWWKHRGNWDWISNGLLVLLVSGACSYYSRPYDEVLALPALVTAFSNGNRRVFLAGFLATNLGYALYIFNIAGHFGFGYMFLWWTASGWLVTYVLSHGIKTQPAPVME